MNDSLTLMGLTAVLLSAIAVGLAGASFALLLHLRHEFLGRIREAKEFAEALAKSKEAIIEASNLERQGLQVLMNTFKKKLDDQGNELAALRMAKGSR